jgi:hypothetical protein
MADMSPADMSAVLGNNEGSWFWIIIILFAFMGNGFGFGGNNLATTDFVSNEFLQRDVASLGTEVANGFSRTNDNLCDVKTTVLTGDMGLQNQILSNRYENQLGQCQTQRDILTQTNELNTNLLTTALQNQSKMDECCCSLKAQGIENTQKILDAMSQNTIDNLRSEVNDLKNTITANGIGSNIINSVRPYPVPAYPVSSPYVGFYGSNWYGNTVV